MKDTVTTSQENIELRSEKVRNIIGKIPSNILRWGISIISIILLIILIAAFYIPYSECIKTKVKIISSNKGEIQAETFVPFKYVTKIRKGILVEIEFEGYDINKYGSKKAMIKEIGDTIVSFDENNYLYVKLDIQPDESYQIYEKMNGTASILLSSESIVHLILNKQ